MSLQGEFTVIPRIECLPTIGFDHLVHTRKAKHWEIQKLMNKSHHPRVTASPHNFRSMSEVAASRNTMEIATQKYYEKVKLLVTVAYLVCI
jgi:hypothetical protein